MMIQITQSGSIRRETVDQAEFVIKCHYSRCGIEFLTVNPDRMYCNRLHGQYASQHDMRTHCFR